MPEGDSLHRAAVRLQVLVGERLYAQALHPRAAALGVAEAVSGKRLERVDAIGKNLLLTWDGGLVLRSHLRMKGRWWVRPAGARIVGQPWLVLRGETHQAVLTGGSVLELTRARAGHDQPVHAAARALAVRRLGPDIMRDPPDLDAMVSRLRAADQAREIGEALLDQRLVAGIGNMWKTEGLFLGGVSPWRRLSDVSDEELRRVLTETGRAMRAPRGRRLVYRGAGQPCRRCRTRIRSRPQGDDARTAYWCAVCQPSEERRPAGA